jgi:hypothetical protein
LVGTDQIFAYDLKENYVVAQTFKMYSKKGSLTTYNWAPVKEYPGYLSHIHSATNDCLYRNRYKFKYMFWGEVPEFLFASGGNSSHKLVPVFESLKSDVLNVKGWDFYNVFSLFDPNNGITQVRLSIFSLINNTP